PHDARTGAHPVRAVFFPQSSHLLLPSVAPPSKGVREGLSRLWHRSTQPGAPLVDDLPRRDEPGRGGCPPARVRAAYTPAQLGFTAPEVHEEITVTAWAAH